MPEKKLAASNYFSLCLKFSPPLPSLPLHPGYGSEKHHLPYSHFWPMYTWKKILHPLYEKSGAHVWLEENFFGTCFSSSWLRRRPPPRWAAVRGWRTRRRGLPGRSPWQSPRHPSCPPAPLSALLSRSPSKHYLLYSEGWTIKKGVGVVFALGDAVVVVAPATVVHRQTTNRIFSPNLEC